MFETTSHDNQPRCNCNNRKEIDKLKKIINEKDEIIKKITIDNGKLTRENRKLISELPILKGDT